MPQLEISEVLSNVILNALENKFVKESRVLDTKDGTLNMLSIMILLENFEEATLIKGLDIIQAQLDRDFYTLSYLIKYIQNCKTNGII
jgi:hypothetical protein